MNAPDTGGITGLRENLANLFPPLYRDRVFLVGGCVRDHLLGRESRDIDLVAALDDTLLAAAGFHLVTGRSTAPIWFRHDRETGVIELTPLKSLDDLESDLCRRDFTINALAMDLEGRLYDPLGGQEDIRRGILTPCSPESFTADPLRIFRAFRFEADCWRMGEACEEQLKSRTWCEALDRIPVERFSREMLKACSAPLPQRFFLGMLKFGIGQGYLPELFLMAQIPAGPLTHHPEGDLLTHSLQVLERSSKRSADPLLRFCALFHDIGKLATDPSSYPAHHGHDQAGMELSRQLCIRLRLPARYRSALAGVSRLHLTLARWGELRDSTRLRTAEAALKAGIAEILPLICTCDGAEKGDHARWSRALEIVRMSTKELGFDVQQLDRMPVQKRRDFILQRRIEVYRQTAN